jgi:hypothetical protein
VPPWKARKSEYYAGQKVNLGFTPFLFFPVFYASLAYAFNHSSPSTQSLGDLLRVHAEEQMESLFRAGARHQQPFRDALFFFFF